MSVRFGTGGRPAGVAVATSGGATFGGVSVSGTPRLICDSPGRMTVGSISCNSGGGGGGVSVPASPSRCTASSPSLVFPAVADASRHTDRCTASAAPNPAPGATAPRSTVPAGAPQGDASPCGTSDSARSATGNTLTRAKLWLIAGLAKSAAGGGTTSRSGGAGSDWRSPSNSPESAGTSWLRRSLGRSRSMLAPSPVTCADTTSGKYRTSPDDTRRQSRHRHRNHRGRGHGRPRAAHRRYAGYRRARHPATTFAAYPRIRSL
ncbi:MAG: hypothetical protein U0841_14235 [Chloroflexia bacterium]